MKNFEIHDLTTGEILSDNLAFEDVPELFKAYENFYSSHVIAFCERIDNEIEYFVSLADYILTPIYTSKNFNTKAEFITQWFMLVEENLCNIY